ncbi:hypothetical protein [Vagococcus fluvialis]|uniref:hypothetical protein n=1 Tax=Vagococcus fluvialis TaxID=2738 RepID=UPI0037BC255A
MRYENRLIRYLVGLIFIGIFLLSGSPSEAEINVSGWKNFGYNLNDFTLDGYRAINSAGNSYDLRKDAHYLGYRGDNILDDITLNGKPIKTGVYYWFNSKSDSVSIKKMGIIDGKSLEVRITPEFTPMVFTINANNKDPLFTYKSDDLNSYANRFDTKLSLFYEGTNKIPNLESGEVFLLPVKMMNGWPDYNFAMLLEKDMKVLIGNQPRDKPALTLSKTYVDPYYRNYRIAIGGASVNNTSYLYNVLLEKSDFYLGKQTVGNFSQMTSNLFEPIDAPVSIPQPYDNIRFQSNSAPSGPENIPGIISEIIYQLPKQENESFYPESIDLEIHKKNISDYEPQSGFLDFFYPNITIDEKIVNQNEYTYSSDTHKITFSKNFLKKYAGKSINIDTLIVPSYYRIDTGPNGIKKYYLGDFKFEIPTSLLVTSHYDTFSRTEFDEELSAVLEMKMRYSLTQENKEVELGKKSTDYERYYFLNVSGDDPFDSISYEVQEKEFKTLTNEETLPVRIYSSFFETSILIELPLKVYENIPVVYKLEDGTLITSDDKDVLHEVKRYLETPVKFKVPFTFDNYTFVSSSNEELQFGETVDNFKEATGLLNTTTKKIELIYKLNKIGVTVEYLLDSETGKYEKHQPVKVGTALNQDKPNIQFETEIGQKITDFIKNNKDQVNPEVTYYHNYQEIGKTANYWRYSDEPVSDKNPLRPVNSEDKIPSRPITITSFYSGTASLNSVDDIDFGTHKNNLKVNEITSKKAINYSFVDTTFNKQTSLNVRFDVPIKNETNQKMTAFLLDYKGKSINQQDVPVIKSLDTEKSIFTGDLKSDLLFKRYWLGPENFGQFSGVLVWTISRDITP